MLNLDEILNQYNSLKTAEEKSQFNKEINKIAREIDKIKCKEIIYCSHCHKAIYKKDLVRKFDTWVEMEQTNRCYFMDRPEYEEVTFSEFRNHCPLCDSVIEYKF